MSKWTAVPVKLAGKTIAEGGENTDFKSTQPCERCLKTSITRLNALFNCLQEGRATKLTTVSGFHVV